MTKRMNRLICVVLALVLSLGMLSACATSGNVVMELNGHKITENMYAFWLSRYKAYFVYYYMNNKESAEMWDTPIDETGATLNETFTGYVKENARTYAAALYLYDMYKLKLSDADMQTIEDDLAELVDAAGGKTAMNAELANFAVNYDMLKEIYIIEAKVKQLQAYLFAEDGPEALTDAVKDEYYQKNYARIKHIFVNTSAKYLYDENGAYQYDEDGNALTTEFTAEELSAQREKAAEVVRKLEEGADFEEMLTLYTEDSATGIYPGGYYLTATSNYVEEVIDATFDMEIGEWDYVQSDLGYHIIKRLDLEPQAYKSVAAQDFFTDFESNLTVESFTRVLEPYMAEVVVNDEIADLYSLKSVTANYHY